MIFQKYTFFLKGNWFPDEGNGEPNQTHPILSSIITDNWCGTKGHSWEKRVKSSLEMIKFGPMSCKQLHS